MGGHAVTSRRVFYESFFFFLLRSARRRWSIPHGSLSASPPASNLAYAMASFSTASSKVSKEPMLACCAARPCVPARRPTRGRRCGPAAWYFYVLARLDDADALGVGQAARGLAVLHAADEWQTRDGGKTVDLPVATSGSTAAPPKISRFRALLPPKISCFGLYRTAPEDKPLRALPYCPRR